MSAELFKKNPECPKCDWQDVKVEYNPDLKTILTCFCKRCSHVWTMKTKDADSNLDAKSGAK